MASCPLEDVWEVRGLPVTGDPAGPGQVTASPSDRLLTADGGGGRVGIIRKRRFDRLEQERRREMRLVETRIEEETVEEARRLKKLLCYGEDDLANWGRKIEPHNFETYSAADFTALMDDLHLIYRARQETISDCISRQMSLEAERAARLRDAFKKYHPLLTRAFHKMPAEVEEQLELETVALNEMMLNNLRQYADIRFGRLTAELQDKQKLQQLWKARRDAWRTLNIRQAERRLSEYLQKAAVESRVEASLSELETSMATVWQHYREHVTGLPDLFLRQVTDEAVDEWQDQAYEILNSMSTMVTTHCKSYRRLYLDLENAWYRELDRVGDELVSREVTDAERWESLADRHTAGMFGPLRSRVEGNVTAARERWNKVVKAASGQVDQLYNYVAASCEVFSMHLAERVRHAKKLEIQLQAVDSQQNTREAQLESRIQKAVTGMMEESRVTRVHQIQQTLAKQMLAFLPTYEQFQERRLQLLLAHCQRLESESLQARDSVAEKLETGVTSPEPAPLEPAEDCHRLLAACRGVLLGAAELSELQSRSVANIRWFLGWERRGLERELGDFLTDKLTTLKTTFCSKADRLADRISEIEASVHDRRCSEIELHQQRVDSQCRAVQEELQRIQSQQSAELEAIRVRLEQERCWMAAHELRSRSAPRGYVLHMMLTQISDRERSFIDSLVERSAAFRQRVETFSADLVESTRAFLRQLIPQPLPAHVPSSRPASTLSRHRRGSVRVSVLKQEARRMSLLPVPPRRATSSRSTSSRPAVRKSPSRRNRGQEEELEEDGRSVQYLVGNFSREEVVKHRATLKKLLLIIDHTVKVQCKSLEHRMELFCGALDEAIKKAESVIRAQIGDVQFAETMQQFYVSINMLIKTEMRMNEEETQSTKLLIRNLADQIDEYERKWTMNMKRESQLVVYFQPSATVQWKHHSLGLPECIMEGTLALIRVEELFQKISARHRYLYYSQLNGTVPFCARGTENGLESAVSPETAAAAAAEPTAVPSDSHLPSAGGPETTVVHQSAAGTTTVRQNNRAVSRSLPSSRRAPRQARAGRVKAGTRSVGGRGVPGRARNADTVSASSQVTLMSVVSGPGSETAPSERPGSSGYTADVSDSVETVTITTAVTTSRKTDKRHNDKKKTVVTLSRMEEPEVITFLFGNVRRPTDSNNFIQKVQRKILDVLEEARETAGVFYHQKGSRAVTRPDMVPATYDDLLETLFARFHSYYTESAEYQRTCFASFCQDFVGFVRLAARTPELLFRLQSELYCRQVVSVTDNFLRQLSEERRLWTETAADFERRLRPRLGHPSQHRNLLSLVELTVDQKESYASRLRQLDISCTAARAELDAQFERSAAFVAERCELALTAVTGAAHLSGPGRKAVTELVTEALQQPREDCQTEWDRERRQMGEHWRHALSSAVTGYRKWTANWFSGVESVQKLYMMCED